MAVEINLISAKYPGFNVDMGASFTQLSCSYQVKFQDNTTINEPSFDRGEIIYYYLELDGSEKEIARGNKGSTAIAEFSFASLFNTRQRIIIRELIPGSHSKGRIIYQESVDFQVQTLEWYPFLKLPKLTDVYRKDIEMTVYPSEINLNSNVCETIPINNSGFFTEGVRTGGITQFVNNNDGTITVTSDNNHGMGDGSVVTITGTTNYNNTYIITNASETTFDITETFVADDASGFWSSQWGFAPVNFSTYNDDSQKFSMKLYRYEFSENQYVATGNDVLYGAPTITPTDYPFTFTPTKLSRYKIKAELVNCCGKIEKEVEFPILDSVEILRSCEGKIECDTCSTYFIDNYLNETKQFKVYDLIINKEIDSFSVEPLQRVNYNFTEDSVYKIEWLNDSGNIVSSIIPIFCQIDKCYVDSLKSQLCANPRKECCDDSYLNNRISNIQAYYQTYMSMIDPYTDLNLRYVKPDIDKNLNDFLEIGKIRDLILAMCDICRRNLNGCFGDKGCL